MDPQSFQQVGRHSPEAIPVEMRRIEGREWWLWGFAVAVTLALTLGIISFTFPWFERETNVSYWFDLREWVRGLAALVLLFDFYAIYQHLQLHRIRRQLAERDQLFQLISENAADMIALVDADGRRLYNSPAYLKVLGYSHEDLKDTSSIDQIHPDDRTRVLEASEKARNTGRGERLEYRIRHKDGSWRLIYVGPAGQLIGSLKPPQQSLQLPQAGGGVGTPASALGTLGGLLGGQSQPGAAGQQPPGATTPGGATPGTNPTAATGTPVSADQGNPANPQAIPTGDTPTVVGGNIIGVGSKINKSSIIIYEKAKNYRLFEFIWDPSKDTIGAGQPGMQTGTGLGQVPGQNPIGQPIQNPGGQQPGQNPTNPPQNPPQQPQNPQQQQ